jgi:hypothetical protein
MGRNTSEDKSRPGPRTGRKVVNDGNSSDFGFDNNNTPGSRNWAKHS